MRRMYLVVLGLLLKVWRFVNADTLSSLQVIESESHPNSHNQGPATSGSKEGLSVYGLFHHLARTPQGKQRLRKMFLRPSIKMSVISERLDAVSILLRPDNAAPLDLLVKHLKRVKNIRTVMVQLRKGITSSGGSGVGVNQGVWYNIQAV